MNVEVKTPVVTFAEAAGVGNGPVSLEPYRSIDYYNKERVNVFERAWLLMGRVEEIPNKGSFVVKDIEVCGKSIILVRGSDEAIRAFHNVCPHRANQVVWEREGTAAAFTCRYHNWSFSTDGKVRGIPDQSMFIGIDKSKCGLTPVSIELWEGWIFINLAKQPQVTLDEFLGGMKSYLSGIQYINADNPIIMGTHLKCNWKVVADAFAEAYHIPAIHPNSLKPTFSNDENRFGRLLDARFFGPHRSTSMFGNADYQSAAEHAVERFAYDPATFTKESIEDLQRLLSHSAVNPTRTRNWSMDVNWIFPNTHIDVNQGGFFVHQFWPLGPGETRHEARFYSRKPGTIRERFGLEYNFSHAADVVMEDLSNVERTQKGIDSRGTDSINLSESEVLIRHGLYQLDKWVNAPSANAALGLTPAGERP